MSFLNKTETSRLPNRLETGHFNTIHPKRPAYPKSTPAPQPVPKPESESESLNSESTRWESRRKIHRHRSSKTSST